MLRGLKVFTAGFLSCLILSAGAFAVAAGTDLVDIKAQLNTPVKFKLNGSDFLPKDSSGNYIKPIFYKGSNYLPVRTIAEALNTPIDYDGKTKTIWIGGMTSSLAVNNTKLFENEFYDAVVLTTDSDKLTTPDKTYKWGIMNEKIVSMVQLGCYLKADSKYKRFTADLFLDENAVKDLVVEFRKTDKNGLVIKSITLKPGETANVDIDISGVDKLFIYTHRTTYDKITKFIVGEPTFRND